MVIEGVIEEAMAVEALLVAQSLERYPQTWREHSSLALGCQNTVSELDWIHRQERPDMMRKIILWAKDAYAQMDN